MLKIEPIPSIPDTPRRYCPPLQVKLIKLPLQQSEQKKEIFYFIAALLECAFEQRPDVPRKWAFPQHMTNCLTMVAAKLAFFVDSDPFFVEVLLVGKHSEQAL